MASAGFRRAAFFRHLGRHAGTALQPAGLPGALAVLDADGKLRLRVRLRSARGRVGPVGLAMLLWLVTPGYAALATFALWMGLS